MRGRRQGKSPKFSQTEPDGYSFRNLGSVLRRSRRVLSSGWNAKPVPLYVLSVILDARPNLLPVGPKLRGNLVEGWRVKRQSQLPKKVRVLQS